MIAAVLTTLALVGSDGTSLRASAADSSTRLAELSAGDALEVRGERRGFLQVWDPRRERAGYVRTERVRSYAVEPASAPELLAIVRFLRDTPGAEALGLAHAALFLLAAPPEAIGPELFDALGTMADRLARRATLGRASAASLDVAAFHGVTLSSFDRGGRIQVCSDGEAFRRVLALGGSPEQRARAALGLSRPECVDPALGPVLSAELHRAQAELLAGVGTTGLPPWLAARLHVRRAAVLAPLAYELARAGDRVAARAAGARSADELAAVDRRELPEEDGAAYAEAAVRVGASRWARELDAAPAAPAAPTAPAAPAAPATPTAPTAPAGPLRLASSAGEPGQSCLALVTSGGRELTRRCTFGLVWHASARASPDGRTLTVAVQPAPSWRELWIFRAGEAGATLDVLPPAADEPDLGYVEHAGFSPDGTRLLVAREARRDRQLTRSFELWRLDPLELEKRAGEPEHLTPFFRWQSPDWRGGTIALR